MNLSTTLFHSPPLSSTFKTILPHFTPKSNRKKVTGNFPEPLEGAEFCRNKGRYRKKTGESGGRWRLREEKRFFFRIPRARRRSRWRIREKEFKIKNDSPAPRHSVVFKVPLLQINTACRCHTKFFSSSSRYSSMSLSSRTLFS